MNPLDPNASASDLAAYANLANLSTLTLGSPAFAPQLSQALNQYTVNSAGGSGGTSQSDPTEVQRQTDINNYRAQLPGAVTGIYDYGNDAFTNQASDLRNQLGDVIGGYKKSQRGIDTGRENVELNRLNGMQDITGFVRNGMKSGASRLANMNATESSGAGAIARAYNSIGGAKTRGLNNQTALQNRTFDLQQTDLNELKTLDAEKLGRTKDTIASKIGQDVKAKLQSLNDAAVNLSIPDRVAVEQEKQRVIDAGMNKLAEVDNWYKGQAGSIKALQADQVRQNALGLQQAGTAATNPYNVGALPGQEMQGAPIDQLPLYVRKRTA